MAFEKKNQMLESLKTDLNQTRVKLKAIERMKGLKQKYFHRNRERTYKERIKLEEENRHLRNLNDKKRFGHFEVVHKSLVENNKLDRLEKISRLIGNKNRQKLKGATHNLSRSVG